MGIKIQIHLPTEQYGYIQADTEVNNMEEAADFYLMAKATYGLKLGRPNKVYTLKDDGTTTRPMKKLPTKETGNHPF